MIVSAVFRLRSLIGHDKLEIQYSLHGTMNYNVPIRKKMNPQKGYFPLLVPIKGTYSPFEE